MGILRVYYDGASTGAVNMARDASFLSDHRAGDDPILRVYRWEPAAVTIGYNQNFSDFDADALETAGFDLVRRPTGGRAILHADELTYAVIGSSPGPVFGTSLHESYLKINEALLESKRGTSRSQCCRPQGHRVGPAPHRGCIPSARIHPGGTPPPGPPFVPGLHLRKCPRGTGRRDHGPGPIAGRAPVGSGSGLPGAGPGCLLRQGPQSGTRNLLSIRGRLRP
jgi:hypothetical protein